jgi:hypothetical protein
MSRASVQGALVGRLCLPKTRHTEYFDIKSRNLFQRKSRNHQTSVTAGTIMDKSKTPLTKWFSAIFLIAEDAGRQRLSVATAARDRLQHRLDYVAQNTRRPFRADGRDAPAEIGEAFFGAPTEGGKRGRGTEKAAVMAAVSLTDD